MRPDRPLGAMRNKEILEALNLAGRDDRPTDVDFYLSNLYKQRKVERIDKGLYPANRVPTCEGYRPAWLTESSPHETA
jgi:hypothetical protein